jgi:hypothetical protein
MVNNIGSHGLLTPDTCLALLPGNNAVTDRHNMHPELRTTRSQSTVELVAGLIVIIPAILVLIDISVIILGATTNDTICRDAARAAAAGQPGKLEVCTDRVVAASEQPYQRARAVVKRVCQTAGAVRVSPDITVTESVRAPVPVSPWGGAVDGEVTVETTVTIYPPFLLSGVVGPGGKEFKCNHTYPYTWFMPNTVDNSGG